MTTRLPTFEECNKCEFGTVPFMPREMTFSKEASRIYHLWVNGPYLKIGCKPCSGQFKAMLKFVESGDIIRRDKMPVKAVKRGKKYRVIEASSGKIAKNKTGSALDGGGHASKAKASSQARAVNRSLARR